MNRWIPHKPWTGEEENLLRTLLEEGKSTTFVAAKLRRTVMADKARANMIGVSFMKLRLKAKGK
jgi:hypothetical protein